MFELFDHTADLGLRVSAPTLGELLADAGRGLLAMHVADPDSVRPMVLRTIEIAADDPAYLLFDWLSELLYAFESEKLLLCQFNIEVSPAPYRLMAVCRGEIMDESRHTMDHEVKAITYHGLRVEQIADGAWEAEVIVDI